jgi:hypothetical protein
MSDGTSALCHERTSILVYACPCFDFTNYTENAPFKRDFCWIDECHTNIIGLAFVCIIDRARPLVLAERSEAVDDLQAEHWPAAFINVRIQFVGAGTLVCGSIAPLAI